MAPSSSSLTWVYDVFPSFSGEDVRVTFLSHFLKELERKLIIAFKDNDIERSRSLDPELTLAIRTSRIAVVVFSEKYASSSWCLNELLEIVKCKKEFGQMVIPVFYRLDPSHVRKQTGGFGKIFEKTCHNKPKEVKKRWREALTDVANILGYHSMTWGNEATMIEAIANDVLDKLLLSTSKNFEGFVGMEDHIAKMSLLLNLESEQVRMVGIWGSSGIGKTTIARTMFNQLSRHFEGSIFIDRYFVSKNMENFSKANPDDYNMKLHLQRNFLSEILGQRHIKIDNLDAIGMRLKNQKVLIFIDDLDDKIVLDALVGQTHWFGCGSRIVAITEDRHLLRAHGIDYIYEVRLPSNELALNMFSLYAFRQDYPPNGFMKFASEVALLAGNLPLGLNVLGSYLRGWNKEDWMDMLPRLRNSLDGKIEKTLKVSYDGLNNKRDEAIFRHIACFFNGEKVNDFKLLLADSDLDVNIGLKNLVDKSLVHVRADTIEMHRLLQEMGKEIVRAQSNEPGEREFLVDPRDIYNVLRDNTGTQKILGIALDIDENEELHVHESAFNEMHNLHFLKIYTKKEVRWHLPESFDCLPPTLRLMRLDKYPLRCLPSSFRPENLVKVQIQESKLEKLWDGVHSLTGLKNMDLSRSENLEAIPDLSMATNLETLLLNDCSSLVELPPSFQYLNKLISLEMSCCTNLESLPTGINLQSLDKLDLWGCSRLKSFPDISTNISYLYLSIEEVPWWIQNFYRLRDFRMTECSKLRSVSLNISRLKHLEGVEFSDCVALTEARWNDDIPTALAMTTNNIHSVIPVPNEASSSIRDNYLPNVKLNFSNCFNLDTEALIQQLTVFKEIILPGTEVPSYFTYRTLGRSLPNIPLLHPSPSHQFLEFEACAVVSGSSFLDLHSFCIQVCGRFVDRLGNYFDATPFRLYMQGIQLSSHLVLFNCIFRLNKDNALFYDHVEIKFLITESYSLLKLKGCGIRFIEDGSSVDNPPCNPNIVLQIGDADEDNVLNDGCHVTEQSEECGDISEERGRSKRQMRVMVMGRLLLKKLFSCYATKLEDTSRQ